MTLTPSPASQERLSWQFGTVERIHRETRWVKTFTLSLSEWRAFRPGQHVDVRLTAPDGYQAQRSYSIASAPERKGAIDLTVELMEDGEVSPYFHDVVEMGDRIELRGPIGGPFTWTASMGGPMLLIGGGSGIVPLMSMLRHRAAAAPDLPALLLYSSRSEAGIIYREELDGLALASALTMLHTLTRERPPGWTGYSRRVGRPMLEDAVERLGEPAWVYVCGPTAFVESVSEGLLEAGIAPGIIRTERFGPSGQ